VTDYLLLAEVLAIHTDQIERYGGSQGVRDPGLLEAALFRPQTGYYVDLIEEAAALWESLAQNHAFIDGNKRTALGACIVFLRLNGTEPQRDNPGWEELTLAVAAGAPISVSHIAPGYTGGRQIPRRRREAASPSSAAMALGRPP